MHERIDATNEMDERFDEATNEETVVTRRAVTKGAAVGGLAALPTAVGAGRALAQDDDQGEDTDDQGEDEDASTVAAVARSQRRR